MDATHPKRPLRSNTVVPPEEEDERRILALCMFYSASVPDKEFGQVYRDRLRLEALEKMGYDAYSCDLSHPQELGRPNRHLQANFDSKRFQRDLLDRWGEDFVFRTVVFDYFYIPEAWTETRYGKGVFISETIPWLMDECRVKELWLPNCPLIRRGLAEADEVFRADRLGGHKLNFEFVKDPERNPLYRATAKVDKKFKESSLEVKCNENQVRTYLDPEHPFIRIY